MSGFIGYYELFAKLELALDIKLEQEEKEYIKKSLYPLSKRNILALKDDDLREVISEINMREKENIQKFLFSYLKANIQDMF